MSNAASATTIRPVFISLLSATALLGWGPPARAQNNSLLGRSSVLHGWNAQHVPTTQPAAGQPLSPVAGIAVRPQPRAGGPADGPPPNTVLLAVSPFAVEPPQPRKIKVHDLVTVIIRESRKTLNDAKMKSEKEWKMKAELAKWFRLDKDDHLVAQDLSLVGTPGVDFDFSNKYEGKGKYDRKDELITRITAKVIDVKPNGNLILEASKEVTVGDEVQVATLTGECRSADVTAHNTVLSTQIANLRIDMPDRGGVRDATRRGWLMRLFDVLRPI